MKRMITWMVCSLVLQCMIGLCFAQDPGVFHFTEKDGLCSMTIYKIIQDHKGYVWMGTKNGLCRYDGREFKRFPLSHFLDEEIVYLAEDRYGHIWINNLAGQIASLNQGISQLFDMNSFPTDEFSKRFVIDEKSLIVSVNKREERDSGSQLIRYPLTEKGLANKPEKIDGSLSTVDVHLVKQHKNWYDHKWRLAPHSLIYSEISGRSIRQKEIPLSHPYYQKLKELLYLSLIDEKGDFYFQGPDERVFVYRNEDLLSLDLPSHLFVHDIIDYLNELLVLTNHGLYIFDKESLELRRKMLEGQTIYHVLLDREGNLWIGTESNGVFLIPNTHMKVYNSSHPQLSQDNVYSLLINKDETRLYAGLDNGELISIDLEQERLIPFPSLSVRRILAIQEGKGKNLWLGGDGGLCHWNNQTQKFSCVPRIAIKAMEKGEGEEFFVATSGNTLEFKNFQINQSTHTHKPEPIPSNKHIIFPKRTYAICHDDGKLWIGTTAGIYVRTERGVEPFLEQGTHFPYRVTSIKAGQDGDIWIGTYNHGLLRINKEGVEKFSTANQKLVSNNCISLAYVEDELYIGTDEGLQIMDCEGNTIDLLNNQDGLPSNEINAIAIAKEDVWIGTPKGLIQFPKSQIALKQVEPRLHLSKMSINGRDTLVLPSYSLAHDQNDLEIHFEGLIHKALGQELYHYRLLGLDSNWKTSSHRQIRFHRLNPGLYTFEIKVSDPENKIFSQKKHMSILIHPAWWNTVWFYVSLVGGLSLLIGRLVYWRIKELKRRFALEEGLQKKINQLRAEALRTQMNPHFIYNALNAIQDFILTGKLEPSLSYLSNFAQMIRFIFEFSDKKIVSLEEELEFLRLYLILEKVRFGDRCDIVFEVEPKVEEKAAYIQIPPLIVQPIIENAFKHGLMHKIQGGKLTIRISESVRGGICCSIEDNGVGRLKAKELSEWKGQGRTASALTVIQERLNLDRIPASHVRPELTIEDLYDSNGEASGTKVILELPEYTHQQTPLTAYEINRTYP